jgi:hypothetical protein
MRYSVNTIDSPITRRLALIAFDSFKLGIWAACQASAGTQGNEEKIQGLLCDDTLKLVSWCSEKRAQMNKPWDITVDLPLNHTMDICTPLVAIFTAPSQAGTPTASGMCWIDSISYRPTWDGGWQGNWHIVKNSQGDTGQNGEVSGWGGSGQWGKNGSGIGIAPGGWSAPPQPAQTWTHLFDFTQTNGKFTAQSWLYSAGETAGTWVSGYGWSSNVVTIAGNTFYRYTHPFQTMPSRTVTGIKFWGSGTHRPGYNAYMYMWADSGLSAAFPGGGIINPGEASAWNETSLLGVTGISFSYGHDDHGATASAYGNVIKSALMGGIGTDPFS